jgi:UDP-N-acetylglucosamine 2-epimerase
VITCEENQQDITNAVKRAVDPSFRKECQQSKNPYGQGNSSEQIVNQLLLFPLSGILNKSFFDMDQNQ